MRTSPPAPLHRRGVFYCRAARSLEGNLTQPLFTAEGLFVPALPLAGEGINNVFVNFFNLILPPPILHVIICLYEIKII